MPLFAPRPDIRKVQDHIPAGVIALTLLALSLSLFLTWWRRSADQGPRLERLWCVFEDLVLMTLMIIMVFAAIVQVTVRYLLSDFITVSWTEELAVLSMIWLGFFAAATLIRSDGHITFDLVYDVMPPSARRVIRILGEILAIAVMLPVAWSGYFNAVRLKIMSTISLGMPVSVYAFAVPVVLTLMAVLAATNLAKEFRALLHPSADSKN